ncbi:MAG: DUF6261 family protein [Parabacteroides sp.]|nr:DUF6261 family protein [Parabacteroides sp.]MDY4756706.1 DUF6261 family protein [Parabacteroides sp.]
MEQISILSLSRLRNEEAFGYFKLVMSLLPYLLKEAEPENPDVVSVEGGVSALSGSGEVINAMLEAPINAFEAAYQAFDVALESSTADSAEAKAYEELRDRLWRSNNAYIKAMTAHPNPELAAIAERVKAEFDKYGDVTYLPVVQESGALHNLIQDIRTISAQDRSKIHYEEWFNALETAENNYLAAVASRTDVRSEKEVGAVKRTRIEAEAAYTHLVDVVNLLAKLEGDTAYLPFINRMNVLIAEQKATLKARQTRAAKAKEPITQPVMPEESETEQA